ncbi:MAG TPA: heavy metal-binding domain-containing protein [Pyrinomonadaceae bacterium]|nr:heavy metal-binding domain-containing protein [Pyrinomonadaceae bacterium]
MKSLRLFIASIFALSLLVAGGSLSPLPVAHAHVHQQGEQEAEPEKPAYHYVCPMHADVTSKKPGKCYKCKMKLEKKRIKVNKPSDQ